MKVISAEEMASRFDYVQPMNPPPEEPTSMWCIPFEYGNNAKGMRISVSKAREIVAELRASIAEVEKDDLRRALEAEKKRTVELERQYAAVNNEKLEALGEIAALKRKLRRKNSR